MKNKRKYEPPYIEIIPVKLLPQLHSEKEEKE